MDTFIVNGAIPRVGDKGSYTSREAYQRFIKSGESIKWYGFECIAIHGNRAIIETAKGYLHGRGDEMVYKIKSRSTPTFTQAQLSTMTLDELERYYNLDPNDLQLCHAYIAKLNEPEQEDNFCGGCDCD